MIRRPLMTALALSMLSPCGADAQGVPTFVRQWGSEGTQPGEFREPWGLAVDGDRLYVADSWNHRIQVFTTEGTFLREWNHRLSLPPIMNDPQSITLDGTGRVLVGSRDRIMVFDTTGVFLEAWGSDGEGEGQFESYLGGIVHAPLTGRVYVSDTYNSRLQMFDGNGDFLAMWPTHFPQGLAVDETGGFLYVANWAMTILKFDLEGNYLARWGGQGSDPGRFQWPTDVAVDAAGRVYVADSGNHRIQIFDVTGGFVATWGSQGAEPGQFHFPRGIALDDEGNVFIADTFNHRLQVFSWTVGVESKSMTEVRSLFR